MTDNFQHVIRKGKKGDKVVHFSVPTGAVFVRLGREYGSSRSDKVRKLCALLDVVGPKYDVDVIVIEDQQKFSKMVTGLADALVTYYAIHAAQNTDPFWLADEGDLTRTGEAVVPDTNHDR